MKGFPLVLALVLFPCTGAFAQDVQELIHLPAARLAEAVRAASAAAPAPVAVTTLEQRDDHVSIIVRRTESGTPELHDVFDDLYIVQEGAAVLVYGGRYDGGETTAPGELRGGTIRDGMRQALAPGDVAVVPAGVPHQVVVEAGKSIIYHVVKVRRGM